MAACFCGVQVNGFSNRLVKVKNTRCAINLPRVQRVRDRLTRIEPDSKCGFETWKIREMQTISLLAFAGRRDQDAIFYYVRPFLEMSDSNCAAYDPDANLLGRAATCVRTIEKKTIFWMRGLLSKAELKLRLIKCSIASVFSGNSIMAPLQVQGGLCSDPAPLRHLEFIRKRRADRRSEE